MTRNAMLTTSVCLTTMLLCSRMTYAQDKEEKPPEMVLKVYRVADLFTPRPDYPYRGGLPTTDALNQTSSGGVSGGYGGGGIGGGGSSGGFGGGGLFQVPDPIPRVAQFGGGEGGGCGGGGGDVGGGFSTGGTNFGPSADETLRFTRADLREAIVTTILPESWDDLGGEAVCTPLGGLFLIKQTPAAHVLIEQLLNDIRTEGGGLHTVTVDALWLSLTSEEFEQLVPKENGQGGELVPLDPALLKELAAKSPSQQGRLSCYNDQTVHLVSGNRKTLIVSAVPTVGFYSTAYQPVIAIPNIGVLFQVRPTVDPDRKSAVLNLTSTVTEWQDPGDPVNIKGESKGGSASGLEAAAGLGGVSGLPGGAASAPGITGGMPAPGAMPDGSTQITLDRVNLKTQHLGTTVRVPVGQPVLVGGMSSINTDPKTKTDAPSRQLYLIVKITVNDAKK